MSRPCRCRRPWCQLDLGNLLLSRTLDGAVAVGDAIGGDLDDGAVCIAQAVGGRLVQIRIAKLRHQNAVVSVVAGARVAVLFVGICKDQYLAEGAFATRYGRARVGERASVQPQAADAEAMTH